MSMGSEYTAELEADIAVLEVLIASAARKGVWTTRDGRRVRVEDMTDSHLANTIAFLRRKDSCDLWLPWIARMEQEQKRRMEARTYDR